MSSSPLPPRRPWWRWLGVQAGSLWFGLLVSLVSLVLAFRQVDLGQLGQALIKADYRLVGAAAAVHLVAVWAMARRWQLLFRWRPSRWRLLRALLVAHLANTVLPVRVSGMVVRAFLVGRDQGQSRVAVFATVVAEKILDSLALLLLTAATLPLLAPAWFHWSSLRLSTVFLAALFPGMVLLAYQRERLLRAVRWIAAWVPGAGRLGLSARLETGLSGLARLQGHRPAALLWLWTLVIVALGAGANYLVLAALGIGAPLAAAVLVLVALQIGNRVVPVAPLGGIGVFQFICTESLALFGVDRELGLSYGFVLHFAVFAPGALLGAAALYLEHCSLRRLRQEVGQPAGTDCSDTEPFGREPSAAEVTDPPGQAIPPAETRTTARSIPAAVPDLTIVIVHHGTPALLRDCLAHLLARPPQAPFEVIVVDNPARRGDPSTAVAGFPKVRLVRNPANLGFATACNQGLRLGQGRAGLLLNPDARIDGPTIDGLLVALDRHPRCGAVAPRLVNPDGSLQWSCRRVPTLGAILLRGLHLGWLRRAQVDAYLMTDWDHGVAAEVDWAIGACLLLRRQAVAEIGWLDEGFFLYYEDLDLCLRLHQAGWSVRYEPGLVVEHQHRRQSARLLPRRQTWEHLRSLRRLVRKHPLPWW